MLESLGKLLPKSLSRSTVGKSVEASMVVETAATAMKEVFGENAGMLHIVSFKNGILKISCDASVYAEELRLREQETIDALNAHIGSAVIQTIKIV